MTRIFTFLALISAFGLGGVPRAQATPLPPLLPPDPLGTFFISFDVTYDPTEITMDLDGEAPFEYTLPDFTTRYRYADVALFDTAYLDLSHKLNFERTDFFDASGVMPVDVTFYLDVTTEAPEDEIWLLGLVAYERDRSNDVTIDTVIWDTFSAGSYELFSKRALLGRREELSFEMSWLTYGSARYYDASAAAVLPTLDPEPTIVVPPTAVPVPAALPLLGGGLLMVIGAGARRRRA